MSTARALRVCLYLLAVCAAPAWGYYYTWDPGCQCWVPDTSGPDIPDVDPGPSDPPDTEPSKFVLSNTGVDAENYRALSPVVSFNHHQPDGVLEAREFQYTTPSNFAKRADSSVNLWLVFHGGNGNSSTMHRYFKRIPHNAPTVVVYPEALRVTYNNVVTTDPEQIVMWRGLKIPGQGRDPNAYRDIAFVERLIGRLLVNNPQLNGNKVYVSGFSSGGAMVWTLMCFRSSLFAGFAVYSHQLGLTRETEGCGNGELSGPGDHRTGYELLTGNRPDPYGRHGLALAPSKPVLYIHGTKDDNLDREGQPGCWKGGPPVDPADCTFDEDPMYSMDYGGPLQERDDISSINWLLSRHQLPSHSVSDCTVRDADPGNSDKVTTHRYEYDVSAPSSLLIQANQQPVTWYEMQGAGHDVSTLAQAAGSSNSTDFEASLHTKAFFEEHAGMFVGPPSSDTPAALICRAPAT
jgi:poly(3-hydroxybutyrate) depolymerase